MILCVLFSFFVKMLWQPYPTCRFRKPVNTKCVKNCVLENAGKSFGLRAGAENKEIIGPALQFPSSTQGMVLFLYSPVTASLLRETTPLRGTLKSTMIVLLLAVSA